MRTHKELGKILLDNQHLFTSCLCEWVKQLRNEGLISNDEKRSLMDTITFYKPPIYNGIYYWEAFEISPRIEWIKKYLLGENSNVFNTIKNKIFDYIKNIIIWK